MTTAITSDVAAVRTERTRIAQRMLDRATALLDASRESGPTPLAYRQQGGAEELIALAAELLA